MEGIDLAVMFAGLGTVAKTVGEDIAEGEEDKTPTTEGRAFENNRIRQCQRLRRRSSGLRCRSRLEQIPAGPPERIASLSMSFQNEKIGNGNLICDDYWSATPCKKG
jgi:hypothetical protein